MNKEISKELAKMVLSFVKDNEDFMKQVNEFMRSHKECWSTCSDGHSQLSSVHIGINYYSEDPNTAEPWFNVCFGSIDKEAVDHSVFDTLETTKWWKEYEVIDEERIFHEKQKQEQQQELPFDLD